MRNAFIQTLEKMCRLEKDIFLLTADLGFKLFDDFKREYPGRFLNMGIAEPNMISVAAGLALSGKKVYCYSLIPFLTMRSLEQIRIDVCYHNLNVRLVGAGSGFSYGLEGVTHYAIEDIAIMRALPNMTVVAPGDSYEVAGCINESLHHKGPIFIRLARTGDPITHASLEGFKIGKGIKLLEKGGDVCIVATGTMLYNAKIASEILLKEGLEVTLISMHTIKPLDEALVKECAGKYKTIISIEEHSVVGGLGSALAEVLSEINYRGTFRHIGLPDKFNTYIGRREYLHHKYGLAPKGIAGTIKKIFKKG